MSNEMTDARALAEIDGYVPRHCRAAIEHIAARLRGEAAQQSCQFCGGTKGHWEGCRAPIESPKWASMDGALRVLVAQCNRIDGDAVRSVDGSIAIPAGAWEAFSGALGAAVGALQFKDTA